jgi:hypothetical protein
MSPFLFAETPFHFARSLIGVRVTADSNLESPGSSSGTSPATTAQVQLPPHLSARLDSDEILNSFQLRLPSLKQNLRIR